MSREAAIRQTHGAVTLEALEALANKGLLRRAQKDLERGEAVIFEMNDAGLTSSIGGQRVTLIETGPAKAACTCPAPGVCQHILAACLQLMRQPMADQGSAHDEWLAFTDADLLAAFGLPTLRAAYEFSLAHETQIAQGSVLTVRFAALNAEVVALPGAGIAGIIVNGMSEKRHAQIAAAAMLAVRRAAGKSWEPVTGEKERSAPAHREEVLKSAAGLLEEIVAAGLARLSSSVVERLDALAISAQTAELHRFSLLLQQIATQAGDWLQRKPHVDLGRIFSGMATAYALAHAGSHLAGVGRESYLEVGSLDLAGVAAWPWRTLSGYEGLTLLLWDTANSAWN
ncbi:MAG: SWIM zinc finger family protein, partial [Verrucomicrobiota bacterium]